MDRVTRKSTNPNVKILDFIPQRLHHRPRWKHAITGQPGEASAVSVNAAPGLEVKCIYAPSSVAVNASPSMDTNFNLKN